MNFRNHSSIKMEESDDQNGFAASWKVRRNDEGEAQIG
jgi:hypothetical protein